MEANKEKTDDTADHYGGLTMDGINRSIHMLIQSVKKSSVYKEYRLQEEILNQNPELAERVRQFRSDNFRLQNEAICFISQRSFPGNQKNFAAFPRLMRIWTQNLHCAGCCKEYAGH